MDNQTLVNPLAPFGVAPGPGSSDRLLPASESGVTSLGGGSSRGSVPSTRTRRRTPGRWRRIARAPSGTQNPSQPSLFELANPGLAVAREEERKRMEIRENSKRKMLEQADELENRADDDPCFSEEAQAGWREFKAKFPCYIRWLADDSIVTFRPTPAPSDTQCFRTYKIL